MKIHYTTGDNVPACRNSINPRGRLPKVTSDASKVTCEKCAASYGPKPTTPARTVGTPVLCNGGYAGTITRVCEWSDALVEVRLERGTVCIDIADCTTP